MKKPPPLALICAGKLVDSPITRLRGLRERLGPVISSSLRLASRFANMLRAGHAAVDYGVIEDCGMVLLSVPDQSAPRFVRALIEADLEWPAKVVVINSVLLDADALAPLAAMGARTASVSSVAGFEDRLFLAEGDRSAVGAARALFTGGEAKLISVERAHKAFYQAAAACTGPLLTSLLIRAAECLKLAGISAAEVSNILQVQASKTTLSFLNAGRKTHQDPASLARQIEALRRIRPDLADFFEQMAQLATLGPKLRASTT